MSNVGPKGRSYRSITLDDLRNLAKIAYQDRQLFFRTHPQWARLYAHRVICIALCQGAAAHYLDHMTGINDFDIYTFYRTHPAKNWYAKRIKSYDFGDPKFGQSLDKPNLIGRRVDCLSRSMNVDTREDATAALRRYLEEGRTETARLLAAKALVLLKPDLGRVIWPRKARSPDNRRRLTALRSARR